MLRMDVYINYILNLNHLLAVHNYIVLSMKSTRVLLKELFICYITRQDGKSEID